MRVPDVFMGPVDNPVEQQAFRDRIAALIRPEEEKSMTVRCKMKCMLVGHSPSSKYDSETRTSKPIVLGRVELVPVSGETPENKAFFDSTPSGKLEFASVNEAAVSQFKPGSSYYVDITEAPE